MKDEKQLVLFFKQGTEVDSVDLASKLTKRFECLKDPIVLPFNPENPNQPLIVFERGDIKLTVGIVDISFTCLNEIYKKEYNTIIEIIEFFEEEDFSFERMGYISTFIHNKKEKELFKKYVFKEDSPVDSEFQVSWYKKELIDSVSVNVWQKGITDMINHTELVSIYDINTPIDEPYNISSEFLKDFLKKCDKYIEEQEKQIK